MERAHTRNGEAANRQSAAERTFAVDSKGGEFADRINNSPAMVAQRRKLHSLFGGAIQKAQEDPPQGRFETAQRMEEQDRGRSGAGERVVQRAGDDLMKNGFAIHNDPGVGKPKIYYGNFGAEHRFVGLRHAFLNAPGSPAGGGWGHAHAGMPYQNRYGQADDITGNPIGAGVTNPVMPNTTVVHVAGHMLPQQYGGLGTPANTFEQNAGENMTNPWRGYENGAAVHWNSIAGNPWVYYSVVL